jgi:drug/metabolite transporter (DMT)-like permease
VGVLSTTIGWSMISSAVRHVPATVAGLFLLLQPALAFVWDILLFDRPTDWPEIFGILLILSAIYLGSYRK